MIKALFFLIFILINHALAGNPVSPRYIIIKKKNGLIEYHKINDYRVTGSGSQKDNSKRVYLFADNYCLTINNYSPRESVEVTNSFNDDYDTFGFVLDENDIETVPGFSCKYKTKYKSLMKRNGVSRQLNDHLKDDNHITQKELNRLLKSYSYKGKATLYPELCDELYSLKKMTNYLVDKGYYSVHKRDKTIDVFIPYPLGVPGVKHFSYELHKDKVINYKDSETKISLTSKTEEILEKSRELIVEHQIKKDEALMKLLGVKLEDKLDIQDKKLGTFVNKEDPIPPFALLALPMNKKQHAKYLTYLKNGGKFIKGAVFEIALMEAVFALFVSGHDPFEDSSLVSYPANILSTIDDKEEREACTRIIYEPAALKAVHQLLEITTAHYLYLDDLANFVKDQEALSKNVINETRSNSETILNNNKTESAIHGTQE